jgi:hypothetical protein
LSASPPFSPEKESIFAQIAASHSGQLIAGATGVKKTRT